MSTAIHSSQNSVQPRAMPYVASTEPVKIHASAHGPHEPSCANTHPNTAVPTSIPATSPARCRPVAQCGRTAGASARTTPAGGAAARFAAARFAAAFARLPRDHRHQPYAPTARNMTCRPAWP